MNKKIIIILLLMISIFGVVGCTNKKSNSSLDFKDEYEALNGKSNESGKKHRILTIADDNPYEKVTAKKVLKMINNKETFYVYFGDSLCPWCRSVIEKSIEVAKKEGIKKIYYVKIWDNDGNEVLRSKYKLDEDDQIELVSMGTDDYYKLLEKFDNVLQDFELTTGDGRKLSIGEKRIYAPNFIYVKNGKAIKMTEGISEKQTDSRSKLTSEILKDEEKLFTDFFNNN